MRNREAAQSGDIEPQHDDSVDGDAGGNLFDERRKSWLLAAHRQNDRSPSRHWRKP